MMNAFILKLKTNKRFKYSSLDRGKKKKKKHLKYHHLVFQERKHKTGPIFWWLLHPRTSPSNAFFQHQDTVHGTKHEVSAKS